MAMNGKQLEDMMNNVNSGKMGHPTGMDQLSDKEKSLKQTLEELINGKGVNLKSWGTYYVHELHMMPY